jgi:prophage DNA circulation protein
MSGEIYQAKLGRFDVFLEDITDSNTRAIAVNEAPFRDGASLDDLGAGARSFRFRAHIMNLDYVRNYRAFMDYLDIPQAFEFIHPIHGLIRGRIPSWDTRHDARKNCAEVDFVFVEQLWGAEVETAPTMVPELEESYEAGQRSMLRTLARGFVAALGAVDGNALASTLLAAAGPAVGQVVGIGRAARSYLAVIDTAVSQLDSAVSQGENPATSLVAATTYPATVPGRIVGAVARAVERYSSAVATTATPTQFAVSLKAGIAALTSTAPAFRAQVAIQGALFCGVSVGRMYGDDEMARARVKSLEPVATFDVLGNRLRRAVPPEVMTANELERSLFAARELMQAAIDADRTNPAPKRMAAVLLRHVAAVIRERERVVTKDVSRVPLHVLCRSRGLSYTAADRLLRMNPSIRNPTFAEGEVQVYG